MKFNAKQQAFIDNKAAGLSNEKAMIAAGYSPNGASQNATALMKKPGVKAAIQNARRRMDKGKRAMSDAVDAGADTLPKVERAMQREYYADPAEFLHDAMNNPALPIVMRARAAEQLMPYKHARIGEKGKKQQKDDDARKVASGGKLSPGAAPTGKVVPIRG